MRKRSVVEIAAADVDDELRGDYDRRSVRPIRMPRAISIDTIRDAATAVYDAAIRTPLVPLGTFVEGGPEIFLKLEVLQPIGSFKIRGAYNAVRQLPREALDAGVWTVSAGNAAQGVALAARRVGARCSVMVMDTAPDTKLRAIERLGATIVKAPYAECWQTVTAHHSPRMTGHFVHPFDDDAFISGNGTVGLEIVEDLPDVDAVVAAVGGGGLLAGIGVALRALRPEAAIYAAEPATAAPLARSFARGEASEFPDWQASFVDGAGGRSVLPGMWPLLREYVRESIVVPLADAAAAMRIVAERARVIAEGAAACAVAAAISPSLAARGHRRIVAVVSGGNVDLSRFAELVGACRPQQV
jgi:threonine dehydratase